MYVDFICDECSISREDFFSNSRKKRYSIARFVFYYVCKQRPMSMLNIVDYMSDNGFSVTRQNIEYGLSKIDKDKDKDLWRLINSCIITFKNQ
jgi:chromosomal replication initiation ATPase DnaA